MYCLQRINFMNLLVAEDENVNASELHNNSFGILKHLSYRAVSFNM